MKYFVSENCQALGAIFAKFSFRSVEPFRRAFLQIFWRLFSTRHSFSLLSISFMRFMSPPWLATTGTTATYHHSFSPGLPFDVVNTRRHTFRRMAYEKGSFLFILSFLYWLNLFLVLWCNSPSIKHKKECSSVIQTNLSEYMSVSHTYL